MAVDPCEGTTVGGGFLRGSRQGWWLPAREPPLMASPCEGIAAGDAPCAGAAINGGSLAGVRRQWRFPRKDPPPMVPPCRELPPMVPSRDPPPTVVPRRDPPPTVVPSQGSTTNGGANAGICHPCWFLHQHSPPTVASTQGLTTTCGSLAWIHHQQCFLRKDPPPVVVPSQGPTINVCFCCSCSCSIYMVSFTLEQAPNTSVRPRDVSYESATMPPNCPAWFSMSRDTRAS